MKSAVVFRNLFLAAFVATGLAMLAAMLLWLPAGAQDAAPGFDGYIQSGTCASPTDEVLVELEDSRSDYAVRPYLAKVSSGEESTVTLAYYGAPLAPGLGYSVFFTDQFDFSLVLINPNDGSPVACGDILEPDDDNFLEIGAALVRLDPVGDSGVMGYAIVERTATERELDIISTQVRILVRVDAESASTNGTPAASPVASN